jgi:hypothetical protein
MGLILSEPIKKVVEILKIMTKLSVKDAKNHPKRPYPQKRKKTGGKRQPGAPKKRRKNGLKKTAKPATPPFFLGQTAAPTQLLSKFSQREGGDSQINTHGDRQ